MLTNRQYAFARDLDNVRVIVTVNNDDNATDMNLPAGNTAIYIGALSGNRAEVQGGRIHVTIPANSGDIWIPEEQLKNETPVPVAIMKKVKPVTVKEQKTSENETIVFEEKTEHATALKTDWSKTPDEMTVSELQAAILEKMAGNGPVTDQMKKTVADNIWHDSLVNWLKSFH